MNTNKNILLVEDDKDDQELFIAALSEVDKAAIYDIANNGKEALNKLENSSALFSLIFMDINMPVMNGIECLSEIVKKPEIRNIPVVILSTDTGHIETVRKLGAKAFIKKPADGKSLRNQLEQLINLDFNTDSSIANQTFQTALSTG